MKQYPLVFPSYYRGNFILVMLPYFLNWTLSSSSDILYGMLVMYSLLESTSKGFVTNFLFLALKRGALIVFGSATSSFCSSFLCFGGSGLENYFFLIEELFFL